MRRTMARLDAIQFLVIALLVTVISAKTIIFSNPVNPGSPQTERADDVRSFVVDYDNDTFLKDGKPFRYISGSLHYQRVPPAYWKDRLTKMYYGGMNAVQTYVPWNLHEPKPGIYNWKDEADILSFLKVANDTGLVVILRAGPYICAEWEMGGLPSWLLTHDGIKLRTSDAVYLEYVDKWFSVLLPKIKPFLYVNGGPIISVQIENEYGSFSACDHEYIRHLREETLKHLGANVILFTVDGYNDKNLQCGSLEDLYTTVDFGRGVDPVHPFSQQRKYQPHGPLVNTEYYPGWFDHWGSPHSTVSTDVVVTGLDKMLALNASVNFYMYHGGTNFGYMNGANAHDFRPTTTSYDYDAPISEPGDLTWKFLSIRNVVKKYAPVPSGPPPDNVTKQAYGKVQMKKTADFHDTIDTLCPGGPVDSTTAQSFEQIGQSYGFMLYRFTVNSDFNDSTVNLTVPGLRDWAVVMTKDQSDPMTRYEPTMSLSGVERNSDIDMLVENHGRINGALITGPKTGFQELKAGQVTADSWRVLGFMNNLGKLSISITVSEGETIELLVENLGRVNYGDRISELKGITGDVTLGKWTVDNFEIFSLDLSNVINSDVLRYNRRGFLSDEFTEPSFYQGQFDITDTVHDTFLNMKGWSKGFAFINGVNLGRYWPAVGPQLTLYVPASLLKKGTNIIKLFETVGSPCSGETDDSSCRVEFLDYPILDGPTPTRFTKY